jgi:hypothetical protein
MIKVKGEWRVGSKVKTFQRDGTDYIHTVPDEVSPDNLGQLTKFIC